MFKILPYVYFPTGGAYEPHAPCVSTPLIVIQIIYTSIYNVNTIQPYKFAIDFKDSLTKFQ